MSLETLSNVNVSFSSSLFLVILVKNGRDRGSLRRSGAALCFRGYAGPADARPRTSCHNTYCTEFPFHRDPLSL